MSKREDVMSNLQTMHTWATIGYEFGRGIGAKGCARIAEWTMDALGLIDAKPRVMTKDEVMALKEGEVAWLEERYEKDGRSYIQPMMSNGSGLMLGTHIDVNVAKMGWHGRRFWTARPTEEEREETAWNN